MTSARRSSNDYSMAGLKPGHDVRIGTSCDFRFNCQTAPGFAYGYARHMTRVLRSPDHPIGSTGVKTRVIAPCFVRPQGAPVVSVPHCPVGACGTTGVSPRPRRHVRSTWPPCAKAHGKGNKPRAQIVCLRSARGWTLRLAASLTGNCRLRRPRPDRTNCRTGMHLDRPPVASASIACPPADPRLSSVIRKLPGPTS
jgi:hypothetical protein